MEMEKAKLLENDADLHIDKKQKTENPQVEAPVAPLKVEAPIAPLKRSRKRNPKAAVDELNSWFNTGDMVLCPPTSCFTPTTMSDIYDQELGKFFRNYTRQKEIQRIIAATIPLRY